MSERTEKSILYLVTSFLKSGGLLLVTFFFTPMLLRYIGDENFGTFKVLTEVYGYLSILDMGLYASVMTCLIPLIKNNSQLELESILSESKRLYLKSMGLTILATLILLPFLPFLTSWKSHSNLELYYTFLLLALTSFLLPYMPYKNFLESSNRGHVVNLIIFFQNFLFIMISILFAYFGWGLLSQGFATVVSGLIGMGLIVKYSNIKIAWNWLKHTKSNTEIKKYQASQILNDLATKISMHCDQLIIAIVLGPSVVTKVFLGQRVVIIMQGQLQAIGQATFGSLGVLYYKDNEIFKRRVLEVTKIISNLSASTLVPVCLLNQPFIDLWVGSQYQMPNNALTYLASANAFLYGLFSFWSFIFTLLGKPKEITKMFWAQAIINITCSIAATYIFGGIGPIIGTLVSFVLVPMWMYPSLLKKHFHISKLQIVKATAGPGIFAILTISLHHYSDWRIYPTTWLIFFVSGICIFFISTLILFLIFFDNEEKNLFLSRLKALWKKVLRK